MLIACAVVALSLAGAPPVATAALGAQEAPSAELRPDSDRAPLLLSAAPDPLFDDPFDLEFDADPAGFPDPIEQWNRDVLGLNRIADRWIFNPVTRVYRGVIPDQARRAVRNFFDNVGSLPVLMNDVFQGRGRCAGATLFRIVVNSTVGMAGFFDPADRMGFERHSSDFGQTMGSYGVGSGMYFVFPLFGPSTARDGFGTLVDAFFNPVAWFLGPGPQLTYGGGLGLSLRDEHYEALKALDESSVDFYAALRNAYYQSRSAHISDTPDCRRRVDEQTEASAEEERANAPFRLASATRPWWQKGRRSCR